MKEIDDTPVPENESEMTATEVRDAIRLEIIERLVALEVRVANLEARPTTRFTNEDPEWYA